ncbi:hypothetical protein BZA77DRAFT_305258 [Pyronema omphalodes]|nr:hypothetical protein BZA77DRAFT_305258 [Pyronema omphalodes]
MTGTLRIVTQFQHLLVLWLLLYTFEEELTFQPHPIGLHLYFKSNLGLLSTRGTSRSSLAGIQHLHPKPTKVTRTQLRSIHNHNNNSSMIPSQTLPIGCPHENNYSNIDAWRHGCAEDVDGSWVTIGFRWFLCL